MSTIETGWESDESYADDIEEDNEDGNGDCDVEGATHTATNSMAGHSCVEYTMIKFGEH